MASGSKRAVVIGVNEYRDAPRLAGCVRDATEIAEVLLMEEYGYEVVLLLDEEAPRRRCLDELWQAAEGSGDSLVLYFAGHGGIYGGAGYLATSDGVSRDPGLGLIELAQIISSASANFNHVITILDACHSGAGNTWVDHRPLSEDLVQGAVSVVNSSRVLMAACRPEQVAFEDPVPDSHGAFTRVLLDGLLGDAVDFQGNVTAHGLFELVTSRMDIERQTPVFKGDSAGSVVLGRGFSPRQGAPVAPAEKTAVLAKAQRFLDEYQILQIAELSRLDHRKVTGLRTCSKVLSDIIRWFDDSENALPDIRRDAIWIQNRSSLVNYQSSLSNVQAGDQLPFGKAVRRVGGGGFGQVWAVEPEIGDAIAYKIFHGSELSDSIKPRRFRNGYHSMAKLSHPRIVAVRELTEAPLGFSMDLIDGADLRDAFIDRSDADKLIDLGIDIADTIRFAHGAGVIHRDIKPENVILAWDDRRSEFVPHLTDFDLAYIETNRTVTINMVGGVVNYAAPEQFYSASSTISRAQTVDVYGFAQLLFYLYVGSDPAADRPDQNVERFTRAVEPLYTHGPAEALIALYKRASAYRPSDRFQQMDNVHGALLDIKVQHDSVSVGQFQTVEEVCRQVAYTYAGANAYTAHELGCDMKSRSGTIDISLRSRGVGTESTGSFIFTLSLSQGFGVPGAGTGAQGRLMLNQRIDRKLQKFNNVSRRPGTHGFFQTHITVENVPLAAEGISSVCAVISAAVSAVEQLD